MQGVSSRMVEQIYQINFLGDWGISSLTMKNQQQQELSFNCSNCKLDKIDEIMVFRHWTVGSISVIMKKENKVRQALGFASLVAAAAYCLEPVFRLHCRAGELKEPNTPTELKRIKSKFEDTKMARIYKAKY